MNNIQIVCEGLGICECCDLGRSGDCPAPEYPTCDNCPERIYPDTITDELAWRIETEAYRWCEEHGHEMFWQYHTVYGWSLFIYVNKGKLSQFTVDLDYMEDRRVALIDALAQAIGGK